MSDFRVRYGMALGPYGTASTVSANHLIPPGDTTPDVSLGAFFVTVNTSATTITYFDVVGQGGINATANNGKVITLLFQDNLTTIANAGQIFFGGTNATFTSGQTISFIYYNSAWYQYPVTAHVDAVGRETVKTITVAGTIAPDIEGVRLLIVNNTFATTIIGLSGGVIGQEVIIMKDDVSTGTTLTLESAANFRLAGTSALVTNDSAGYRFVSDNGTRFRSVSGLLTP